MGQDGDFSVIRGDSYTAKTQGVTSQTQVGRLRVVVLQQLELNRSYDR